MTLPFEIADDAATPLFLRIARAIIADIERGRLKAGAKMPGTRTLAADLGVHRKTVVAAYEELVLQGWITILPSRGAMVALDLQVPDRPARPEPAPGRETSFTAGRSSDTGERPPALAFSDGTPDPRLLPRGELARAFRRALGAPAFLSPGGYGDPRGNPRLRAALADWLAGSRGLAIGADDVLITRGSQMALFLAARAVAEAAGAIAVEDPGYPLAWTAFRAAGARIVGVPVDGDGIDIAALDALARRDRAIRAVLVTPHHHYPTTVTLGAGRRLALLKLAATHGWTVIEDDYDHEYRYEGRPILPLAASAPAGARSVIYVGSLSKLLAPGLRLGYAIAAPDLIGTMAAAREAIDRQGDVPLEAAIAELIADGELRRHARKARKTYLARRDLLIAALRRDLGDAIAFDVPAGGLALWLRVRPDIDAGLWARRALDEGLKVPTGVAFAFDPDSAPNAFRLGFAALDPGEIARAVHLLSAARPR